MSFSGLILLASLPLLAQDQTAGQRAYDTRCGRCHGGDGRGSDMAPSMLRGVGSRDDAQFTALIRLTWATGMTPEGRPIKAPNQEPSAAGTYVCPSQDGASNFYSPSYIPSTGLFYFHAFEKCSVYTKRDQGDWTAGKAYLGGSQQTAPGVADHYLRALDIKTGKTVWELPQPGPAQGWGGTIATATGLIFFGEENGAMMAADATTGKPLWRFETNQNWKASPMAYMFDGKQFIAGIAGGNVLAFGLPD